MLVHEEGAGLFSFFASLIPSFVNLSPPQASVFPEVHGEVPQGDPGGAKLCLFQPCPWPSAGAVG